MRWLPLVVALAVPLALGGACDITKPDPLTVSWVRMEPDQIYPKGWVSAIPDPGSVNELRSWFASDPAASHGAVHLKIDVDVDEEGHARAIKRSSLEGLTGDEAARVEADVKRQVQGWKFTPARDREHALASTLKLDISWDARRG